MNELRTSSLRPLLGAALAAALSLLSAEAHAQVVVAPDDAGKILMRAATMDKNLTARSGGTAVVIGVVSRAGDPAAVADGNEMAATFKRLGSKMIGDRELKVETWSIIKPEELSAKISASPTALLYVSTGFSSDELPRIAAAAEKAKSLCTYRTPSYDGQLAMGVVHTGGRARLVINQEASKRAGVDFELQLLRLALLK